MLNSKGAAWCAFFIIIIALIFTFSVRTVWWSFFDIFFAYMATFFHLIAIYAKPRLYAIGRQMELVAAVFFILAIIAFIIEFIFWQIAVK